MSTVQESSFRQLLAYVWKHSRFYRDYYASHGIGEKDLGDVTVRDLPFLTKKILMENFDDAVTDPRLRRQEIDLWAYESVAPQENFSNEFIVIRSSGTSGYQGTFIYDQKTWRTADLAIAARLPPPENYPGRTRVAWYIDSHGRRAADLAAAVRMPKSLYEILMLSLVEDAELIARRLNAFQPHRLVGYSSCVSTLADMALRGNLQIRPQKIFVSGDLLTDGMKEKIQAAWKASVFEFYAASEALYIALKSPLQDEMDVVQELNIVEVLGSDHRTVSPGEPGRVVLTNLYNHVLPVLRYELGDHVLLGKPRDDCFYTAATLRSVKGRANDALPVVLKDGQQDSIHPLVLPIYVPGLEKIQFISRQPDRVEIQYVGEGDLDVPLRREFQQILDLKGATRTSFAVQRVPQIANDPRTGKFRLIRIEGSSAQGLAAVAAAAPSKRPADRITSVGPVNSFVKIRKREIEQSIPARFEQMVRQYPERTAIKVESQEVTYTALNQAANRVARAVLQERGAAMEPIALLLEKGASMMAAILGVLKTGKIYVPLDPSHPRPRIKAMLEDSQAGLIVTDSRNCALAGEIAQSERPVLNLDDLPSDLSGENLGLSISPDNLAYILYTSGSTGEPKGVVQNHRNVLYKTRTYTNNFHFCAADRISLLSPCTFSLSVGFIFGALLNGACLYPIDIRDDGLSRLKDWLIDEGVTVYNSVPTAFRSFVATFDGQEKFPDLRLIHMGGALHRRDVELYREHFGPDCIMVHDLGSNESGTIAQYLIDKDTPIEGGAVPSGYAVDGGEILILDEFGKEAGFDRIGEIALKSRYLAVGYWRRPELTQSAFWSDPAEAPKRIYRTGDLGTLRFDGRLQYLGRKDFQVKVRGHRIEVTEIELALVELAAIKETVVVAQEDEPNETYLVAYVVSRQDPVPLPSALRRSLKEKLPEPMVPSTFVFLDRLPLTPNGKVDRQALPRPDRTRVEREEAFVAPRNPMEQQIAAIWAEVLDLAHVGIHDDFFDLGGHSLSAARVLSRVRSIFHVDLPFEHLLATPTVANMASVLVQHQVGEATDGELRHVLAELDALSDEETQRLIAESVREVTAPLPRKS